MCGIAGIISTDKLALSTNRLQKMTDAIAHRGPNGQAHWINQQGNAGFGHRRLAIIDLSDAAAQPMHYLHRYTIVHNGELYNYIEIKEELKKNGYSFTSQSDTEVILAAYDCWKETCLPKFDGMFAFAIWDEKEQQLFAARDRFGEKPFYYCNPPHQFLFASEMKALWAAGFQKVLNEQMLCNFLALGQVENAYGTTAYKDIVQLPAAHYLQYTPATNKTIVSGYWKLDASKRNTTISEREAIETFTYLLRDSVKKRLRSDVPIGTSLSGGLDSSSIVSIILQIHPSELKTYSAVFPGFIQNELPHIEEVKKYFQVENHQVQPTAQNMISSLEKIMYHQEEPIASSSVYAQFKVFELAARQNIHVLLDGQGADETMAGYHKYYHWFWQELYRTNRRLLKSEINYARNLDIKTPWNWKNKMAAWFPKKAAEQLLQLEIKKLQSNTELNKDFVAEYFKPETLFKPAVSKLNHLLHYNTSQFGLQELLRYADRNAMAFGTEVRLPFLQHQLVEFVFSLPAHYKIQQGYTKWILRKAMDKQLPDSVTWRKDKVGFEPPQKKWMENKAIQDFIVTARKKLVEEKILDASVITKKIQPQDAHAADNFDWRYMVVACLI